MEPAVISLFGFSGNIGEVSKNVKNIDDGKRSNANETRIPRLRPTSKPEETSFSGSDGSGGRSQRELNKQQTSAGSSGSSNAYNTAVRYLPRYKPLTTTEGITHLFSNDSAVVGKDVTGSSGKDGSDPFATLPMLVPYLPIDTYYIPLRRLTRGHKKPVVT
jgi:hypothetical protein